MTSSYYAPTGGLPGQTELTTDRAVFTEAYAVLPRGTMRDIVTSYSPFWDSTRLWVIARPLSGFAETFSQYIVEVQPGGGSDRPETDPAAEAVLFVVEGALAAHGRRARSMSWRPVGTPTSRRCGVDAAQPATRPGPVPLDPQGLPARRRLQTSGGLRHQRAPTSTAIPMPGTDGAWTTQALRRSGRRAARHARQHRQLRARAARSRSRRRTSWNMGSTCSKARPSTCSTGLGRGAGGRLHVAARLLPAGLLCRRPGPFPLPALQRREPPRLTQPAACLRGWCAMRKNSSEDVIRLVESHQPGALLGTDNQPPRSRRQPSPRRNRSGGALAAS